MTPPVPALTVREVCALLRVCKATVHKWIRTGELRSLKIGRSRRVRQTDLERFIERKRGA